MEFRRIPGLPPYVFTIIDGLKVEARRAGRDVIDLGFGNPDIPSPEIAVEKLAEAAHNTRNHRYSASAGASRSCARPSPTSTSAASASTLDPDTEVITTIGAKEGFSHLMWVLLQPGDAALVPSPSYPIHIWGPYFAGADVRQVPDRRRRGLHRERHGGLGAGLAQAPGRRAVVPAQPHDGLPSSWPTSSASSTGPASATSCSCTTSPTPRPPSTGGCRRRSSSARAPRSAPSSCTR